MKIFIEQTYGNMIEFTTLIERIQGVIGPLQIAYPDFSFIVLKIDKIRLRVQLDSTVEDLKKKYDERKSDLARGLNRHLDEIYRVEELWN